MNVKKPNHTLLNLFLRKLNMSISSVIRNIRYSKPAVDNNSNPDSPPIRWNPLGPINIPDRINPKIEGIPILLQTGGTISMMNRQSAKTMTGFSMFKDQCLMLIFFSNPEIGKNAMITLSNTKFLKKRYDCFTKQRLVQIFPIFAK